MTYKLREIRKLRGMTQTELAQAAHIHRVTIAKYEAGQCVPSVDRAERLAAALGVTVDELIGKEEAS